jgi:hypothetical protein
VSILAAAPTGSVLQQLNYGSGDVDIPQLLARIKADLHPGQLAFVDDAATQIIGISAGYGAGKTRALCAKAVMLGRGQSRLHRCSDGADRTIDP